MSRPMRFYVWTVFIASIYTSSYSNRILKNTSDALNVIRSGVLKKAKDIKWKVTTAPSWLVHVGMSLLDYDAETRSNFAIARPFFVVKFADECLRHIGSDADIAYIKSVFEEFYGSGEQSLHRLINILHRHMMVELGFPSDRSLEQFKRTMEKTNKHGFPTMLSDQQFQIYARCVARGLYAVYWLENRYC